MMKKSKNFAFALCLAMLSITPVHAVVPAGTTVAAKASGLVKGGTNMTFTSIAPTAATYKVLLQIPSGSTATNALYRVYPKGTSLSNTTCSATDATYPCFEITVNQALNQGKWIQLTANTKKQWSFAKNGYVVVNPVSLPATELLGVATVKFEEISIYPTTGYSKISNSGALLADSAVLGTGATNWACTRDNKTGLIWEVKTNNGGLRDKDNRYSWYNPNSATNGGFAGYQNRGRCTGGISCDTDSYVKAVNTQKLCGFSDWKMPSKDQLLGLVNIAYYPAINPTYFPNTLSNWFWSSSPYAYDSSNAWIVVFYNGCDYGGNKYYGNAVRLVRGGQ